MRMIDVTGRGGMSSRPVHLRTKTERPAMQIRFLKSIRKFMGYDRAVGDRTEVAPAKASRMIALGIAVPADDAGAYLAATTKRARVEQASTEVRDLSPEPPTAEQASFPNREDCREKLIQATGD